MNQANARKRSYEEKFRRLRYQMRTAGKAVIKLVDQAGAAALGVDGALSIELEYSPEPEKIVEWVTEAYAATAQLMRAAGLRE